MGSQNETGLDLSGRWRKLALDTAVMTASAIVMRCIGMAFQVWLVGRIGASGIGLYQLVASVNMLCATFAISGIRFTTTRLISEEIGSQSWGSIGRAIRRCVFYALFFGLSAFAVLYLCAEPIGFLWVGDARTVMSLHIIAIRMPFVSVASVLNGYLLGGLQDGKWKKLLFAPTGALLSPVSSCQGETIPGICHAILWEGRL